ncbi:MAG: ArsC/Spx/MgsR family protein [Woeseiaceae bacterium]
MLTMYHNPRCSKSRKTLEIIQDSGSDLTIIEYLQETPDASRIQRLAGLLGIPVADLLRRGEDDFKSSSDLPDLDDDAAVAMWIEQHPKTLQRPIVVDDEHGRAVVGRPPENVQALLGK